MDRLSLRLLLPFALTAAAQLPAQKVEWWQQDFSSALAASKDSDAKMVLLYFWRDPHAACESMFGVLSEDKAAPELVQFVCMGAQADTDVGRPLFDTYKIQTVPTVVFVKPDGQVVDLVEGYVPVAGFLEEVKRIKSGEGTVSSLRDAITSDPTAFEKHMSLVNKLRAIGDAEGALEVIEGMIKKDPRLKNEHVAEAMLMKITDEIFKPGLSSLDFDLEPLRKFLAKQRNKRVKYLGYDQMATVEYSRDNLKVAAKYAQDAWKNIPKDQVREFGQRMSAIAYARHEELDKIDKKFLKLALTISKKALAAADLEVKKTPDDKWHANAICLHAQVLIINNKRKDAFAAIDRALELDPTNEYYKQAKKKWVAGGK